MKSPLNVLNRTTLSAVASSVALAACGGGASNTDPVNSVNPLLQEQVAGNTGTQQEQTGGGTSTGGTTTGGTTTGGTTTDGTTTGGTTTGGTTTGGTTTGGGTTGGTTTGGTTTTTRPAPNWQATEPQLPWDYKAVYPSRSACGANEGKVFEVGEAYEYKTLKDVPWLTLIPCDQVNIHYQAKPYRDIIFLGSRGAANKWITVRGVAGPNGEMPIIDGDGAVMPNGTGATRDSDSSGMIIIKRPSGAKGITLAPLYKPGYLHITGLKIRNARPPYSVTTINYGTAVWDKFTSGIYINGAEKVAITHCDLGDNGLGIFANSTADEQLQTRNLLIAHNYIHGNSNPNTFSEHNVYTEGIGTVFEYNYFAPIVANSAGDNIKERSAGVIFRYNYIEDGSDLIALRDPESNVDWESKATDAWGERLASAVFIYGNIFVNKGYNQAIIGHGDGSMGTGLQPRDGYLYFYGNRVITKVDNQGFWQNNQPFDIQGIALFDLLNTRAPTTVVALNNLLYATSKTPGATPAPISLFYWQGIADFQSNWANNFTTVRAPFGGTNLATGTKFDGTGLGGLTASTASPGFIDAANGNYLTDPKTSPFASGKAALPQGVDKRGLAPTAEPVISPAQALAQ